MTKKPFTKLTLIFIVGLLALFACVPQTPIPVYITPTPQPAVATPVPTVETKPTETTPIVVTAAPQAVTEIIPTIPPGATIIGPVIGPGYTLQPTETPKVSPTPAPSVTPVGPPPTVVVPTLPGPTGTPLPHLDPARMGIQVTTNLDVVQWNTSMDNVARLGVGWVKVQAQWSFLQPNSGSDFGQEFGLFQLHVQNAKQRGFKVLISVAKAPQWARSVHDQDGPPDNPQLLADFISFLLSKVGDRTDAIEIWNEPNLKREWTGALPFSGAGYMRLFTAAYNAVHSYSPSITVVTAGLAPTGDSQGSVDDRTYLQQMYNAGLGNYRDAAIGFHPYSWGNPPDARCCNNVDGQSWDDNPHFFFSNTIDEYHNLLVKNGHGDSQLWATEFGWATWDGIPGGAPDGDAWMNYNNITSQANDTIRAFEIGQSISYLGPMFLWNLDFANEFSIAQRQEVAAYSLLIPIDGKVQTRPLYYLLQVATHPH